jgi:ubiquinone/menaquinone biosynthesis C-methylase UbiE
MAPSFDVSSGLSPLAEQHVALPRLFNLDLPHLLQTGHPLPEQAETAPFQHLLDVASGSGEWALLAAQALPEAEIVGIENNTDLLSHARAQAEARGIENVVFTALDPFQRFSLSENTFDLVNARYLVGLLPASAWKSLLSELVRVTRPGGVLRLTETDLPITNSVATEQLSSWTGKAYAATKRSFSPTGRTLSMTPMLLRLLQDAGCQDIKQMAWTTNFSASLPASTPVTEDLARTYQLLQAFLVSVGVAAAEEIEQVYQQMLTDMQSERFAATAISLTVWGIKP